MLKQIRGSILEITLMLRLMLRMHAARMSSSMHDDDDGNDDVDAKDEAEADDTAKARNKAQAGSQTKQ